MNRTEIETLVESQVDFESIDAIVMTPKEIAEARRRNREAGKEFARLVQYHQTHPAEFAKAWEVYNDNGDEKGEQR